MCVQAFFNYCSLIPFLHIAVQRLQLLPPSLSLSLSLSLSATPLGSLSRVADDKAALDESS